MHLPCLDALEGSHQIYRETGSTTWFREYHECGVGACDEAPLGPELGGVHVNASPFGAKRLTGQPSHRRRKRQSSSELALKPAGGRFRGLERPWQVVRGLHSRLRWLRVRYCLGVDGDCWGDGDVRLATWLFSGPKTVFGNPRQGGKAGGEAQAAQERFGIGGDVTSNDFGFKESGHKTRTGFPGPNSGMGLLFRVG